MSAIDRLARLELYGLVRETPQTEITPSSPRSPNAGAMLYAYWITVNYREANGLNACNGILFNHESPRRGESFVTRGMANISQGREGRLYMGNIDVLRDWVHAKEHVCMQWPKLQQAQAEDIAIAVGQQYRVRQCSEWSAAELGMQIRWIGEGINETGRWNGKPIVRIDPRNFRPTEVETLLGDANKARQKLDWVPEITAQQMCAEMVAGDLALALQNALLKKAWILRLSVRRVSAYQGPGESVACPPAQKLIFCYRYKNEAMLAVTLSPCAA